MELKKSLTTKEKIRRNFIFAALAAIVAVFLAKNDFAAILLLAIGIVYGVIVAQNYLKK